MEDVFHPGELEMQRRAGAEDDAAAVSGIIAPRISAAAARFLSRQRFLVASTLDSRGRVWASLLAGPEGFAAAVDGTRVGIAVQPIPGDPISENLARRPELGLLAFDPRTRQRIRLNGRARRSALGFLLDVEQAYGNCPKYIQLRAQEPDARSLNVQPRVGRRLDGRTRAVIEAADTFFIASFHPRGGADASHRGGLPGFVAVRDETRIAFPDYPGNAMFNTLGNLVSYPMAGLLFVDFTNGDVLQLTGVARINADRTVVVDVDEVRETRGASPLRYRLLQYSAANPSLDRHAAPECGIQSREEAG